MLKAIRELDHFLIVQPTVSPTLHKTLHKNGSMSSSFEKGNKITNCDLLASFVSLQMQTLTLLLSSFH